MRVSRIRASGIASNSIVDLSLPSNGLVLITGPNGAGKSTIVECVPLAVWGKSIRGDVMWSESGGEVEVEADGRTHRRTRGKKSTYTVDGESEDTILKTMKAVGSGDFDMWRRTCAFSLDDRRSFCSATPSDRVRIIETLVSMPGFDDCLKKARLESKRISTEADKKRAAISVLERRIPDWKDRLERLLSVEPPEEVSLPEVDEDELERAREAVASASAEADSATSELAAARSELSSVRRRHVPTGGVTCERCGQEVPMEHAVEVRLEVEVAEEGAKARVSAAEARSTSAKAVAQAAKLELEKLTSASTKRETAEARRSASMEAYEASRSEAIEVEESLGALESQLSSEKAELEAMTTPLANHEGLDTVLGTNGWRMSLMSEAAKTMEAMSNSWLVKMLPGCLIKLGAGDVPTDMRMSIEGVGRGTYSSLSGGQRRKVEVATTIALAQLASSTAGWPDSTLFFDEVFDGLDEEGREAAASCLVDISAERCVVVITHNEEFRKMLPSAAWYQVEDGEAVRRS